MTSGRSRPHGCPTTQWSPIFVPSSMTTLGPTTLKRPISTLAAIRAAGSMYDSPVHLSHVVGVRQAT